MPLTRSEVEPGEKVMCLYPGCEREAVSGARPDSRADRQGPPPRYCEDEDHHAASAFREMKRLEDEAAEAAGGK